MKTAKSKIAKLKSSKNTNLLTPQQQQKLKRRNSRRVGVRNICDGILILI